LEISPGIYVTTFTASEEGIYAVMSTGIVHGEVEIVARPLYAMVANIEDECLGNWQLDKRTGELTLYRQNGAVMTKFNTSDTATITSRATAL
jgi:hypothetical protein